MLGHEENILIQSYSKYVCIFEIALILIHEKMRGHGYRIEVYFTDLACLDIYCWVVYYMFYCQLGNEIPGAVIPTTTGLGESGHAV